MPTLITRFTTLPAPPLEQSLHLTRGSMRDYAQLAEHHYRAHRPATATRVLVLTHQAPTASDRFLRAQPRPRPVAVLVESLPALCCRLRDEALPRYRLRNMSYRGRVLNEEVRCISRVVVDPRWRGLGLAVRLVKAALHTAETPYIEALAAMGRVNPFFERAGMTAYLRPPHEHDARLTAALAAVGIAPTDLALLQASWARIESLPAARRNWLLVELRRWYARTHRSSAALEDEMLTGRELLEAARERLLCEPVYYLYHRDRA